MTHESWVVDGVVGGLGGGPSSECLLGSAWVGSLVSIGCRPLTAWVGSRTEECVLDLGLAPYLFLWFKPSLGLFCLSSLFPFLEVLHYSSLYSGLMPYMAKHSNTTPRLIWIYAASLCQSHLPGCQDARIKMAVVGVRMLTAECKHPMCIY